MRPPFKNLKLKMQNSKLGFEDFRVLIERVCFLLKKDFQDSLLSFAVFGSVAKGQANILSDIDILIVYRKSDFDPLERFVSILRELREDETYSSLQKKGVLADPYPVFLSEEELKRHPWILLDLIEDSVIIYDKANLLKNTLEEIKERLVNLGAKKIILSDGSWYWDLKPDWKPGEVIEI